jgi:hypothetical protein
MYDIFEGQIGGLGGPDGVGRTWFWLERKGNILERLFLSFIWLGYSHAVGSQNLSIFTKELMLASQYMSDGKCARENISNVGVSEH